MIFIMKSQRKRGYRSYKFDAENQHFTKIGYAPPQLLDYYCRTTYIPLFVIVFNHGSVLCLLKQDMDRRMSMTSILFIKYKNQFFDGMICFCGLVINMSISYQSCTCLPQAEIWTIRFCIGRCRTLRV